MNDVDLERSTAEALHEVADMPGEDSYVIDVSADDLSVLLCGVCPVQECDWSGQPATEEREALRELVGHLKEKHSLYPREEAPEPDRSQGSCPACGSARIEYHEDVVARRRLLRIEADGALVFDGLSDSFDDDGTHPRLWCGDCSKEWDLPERGVAFT